MTAIIIVVLLSAVFDFLNGIKDSSSMVATMVMSRAYSPRLALGITAIAIMSGPFLFGVALAKTIGRDIVNASTINTHVLVAALVSAILWNLLSWYTGMPSSSSHALIGGLIGGVVMGAGWQAILLPGLVKVLITLFISPIIGFLFGFLALRLVYLLSWNATPRINVLFRRSQIITSVALAISYGANDAQKTMGLITLALITGGELKAFVVPVWVIILCAGMIAVGSVVGGWRLIRTLGGKFYKIRPVDGFSSQLAAASVTLGASLIGGPVSSTQVVSSAIMGVGAAERLNKVRWGVAQDIAVAWVLTIPASALVSAGVYLLINRFL